MHGHTVAISLENLIMENKSTRLNQSLHTHSEVGDIYRENVRMAHSWTTLALTGHMYCIHSSVHIDIHHRVKKKSLFQEGEIIILHRSKKTTKKICSDQN